jgi:hypothetical protein
MERQEPLQASKRLVWSARHVPEGNIDCVNSQFIVEWNKNDSQQWCGYQGGSQSNRVVMTLSTACFNAPMSTSQVSGLLYCTVTNIAHVEIGPCQAHESRLGRGNIIPCSFNKGHQLPPSMPTNQSVSIYLRACRASRHSRFFFLIFNFNFNFTSALNQGTLS